MLFCENVLADGERRAWILRALTDKPKNILKNKELFENIQLRVARLRCSLLHVSTLVHRGLLIK